MKFPLFSSSLMEAKAYALESMNHTMNYDGWADQHRKLNRIVYGKFAQIYVADWCQVNGINYKKDISTPYIEDKEDIIIQGKRVDVKCSCIPSLVGQVSPGVVNSDCDYFCFLLLCRRLTWVEPHGFISCDNYRRGMIEVLKDQKIPETNIIQRFGSSYFLSSDSRKNLLPFVQTLLNGGLYKDASQKRG